MYLFGSLEPVPIPGGFPGMVKPLKQFEPNHFRVFPLVISLLLMCFFVQHTEGIQAGPGRMVAQLHTTFFHTHTRPRSKDSFYRSMRCRTHVRRTVGSSVRIKQYATRAHSAPAFITIHLALGNDPRIEIYHSRKGPWRTT